MASFVFGKAIWGDRTVTVLGIDFAKTNWATCWGCKACCDKATQIVISRGVWRVRVTPQWNQQMVIFLLMCINVMTPFSLRDSNQKTACARSVRVSPNVCCQVYKVQVSVSNIVSDATRSRVHTTSIHKYPPSVSCHVPRCSIPSQHISPMMRPNAQNPISINTPIGDDDCNVFRLSGMSSYR